MSVTTAPNIGIPILYSRDLTELGILSPVCWDMITHPHLLIVGSTGSGKTYAERLIIGKVCKYLPDAELAICDFKNEDFRNFDGLSRHFGYEDCIVGLNEFYKVFQLRLNGEDETRTPRILLFDEWGAFVTSRDKKEADEVKKKLSTLLMLGRSYRTHVVIGLQRADSEHFKAGARDNFSSILALGNLSKEQRQMLFSDYKDEMVSDCGRGSGYLLRDGKGVKRVVVPEVRNIDLLNLAIAEGLTRNALSINTKASDCNI